MKRDYEKISLEKCHIDQISEEFINNHKELKTQFEELNKYHTEKLRLLDISEESLKKTQKILIDKTEKINNIIDELEKARNNLNEKNEKIEALIREKEGFLKENIKLKEELFKSNTDLNSLHVNISEQNLQINNFLRDLEFLSEEKKDSKSTLINLRLENDKILFEINNLRYESRNEIHKLKEENICLNNLLKNNNKELESLKCEFEKLNEKQIKKNLLSNNLKEKFQKENLINKKKIDELNFQIENYVLELEEKKIIIRNFEKDNELIKLERDRYIKFYEKEKMENANNLDLIKLLEEEKNKNKNDLNYNKNTTNKDNQKYFNPLISENNSAKISERNKNNTGSAFQTNLNNLKICMNSCNGLLEIFLKKYKEFVNENKEFISTEDKLSIKIKLKPLIFYLNYVSFYILS